MAIRIERSGQRTVAVQSRRPVRFAAWGLAVFAVAGVATTLLDSREREETRERDHARVRCKRLDGQCEVARGPDSSLMGIDTLSGVTLETDGEGPDARVIAVIRRRHGLATLRLCEARASDPEAAGIRAAADQLARFAGDRRVESVDVACDTRRRAATGGDPVAGRLAAQLGGTLFILLVVLLYLVEIRTEIDGEAGVVRIRGRRALPPGRRWSIERPIAEVAAVESETRWGYARSFSLFLRFTDGSTATVLSPVTGWRQKVSSWQAELSRALGLPPPPAGS